MINPRNLLSDEERMQLQAWGQEIDRPCWKIGYFVVERMVEINAEVNKFPKMTLYKEIGKEVGKSAETVRGYYYVCSHVPKKTFRLLGEFGFSQFRRMVPTCGASHSCYMEKFIAWEHYCVKTGNDLTSVDGLTAFINKGKNKEPQERKWYRQAIKYLEKLEASSNVPTPIRQLIMHFTARISGMEWEQ